MAKDSTNLWVAIIAIVGGLGILGSFVDDPDRDTEQSGSQASSPETFRLVHAAGNDETEVARGLSRSECDRRKADNTAVAEALGIHSERLGTGSIACLPESVFQP